jgi:threonine/homoserine/homoserine lactone efflux protein
LRPTESLGYECASPHPAAESPPRNPSGMLALSPILSNLYLKGIIIGALIAAPIGPVNIMTVRRTLVHGHIVGLVTGLGAALGDTILGAITAFGFGWIIGTLTEHELWISLIGAAILVVMGVKTMTRPPPELQVAPDPRSLIGDCTSALALVLSNPITILSFLPVFAAFGISFDGQVSADDWLLVLGILTGSSGWWVTLVVLVGMARDRLTRGMLVWVNRITGALILFCALYLIVAAIRFYLGRINMGWT